MAGRARVRKPRLTRGGDRRHDVVYRIGGQAWPEQHGGTFPRKEDAERRRDRLNWILAGAASPEDAMRQIAQLLDTSKPASRRTMIELCEALLEASLQLDESTKRTRRGYLTRLRASAIGGKDALAVTVEDVQAFVGELAELYAPSTLRNHLGHLAQGFDHGRVKPNPARDDRLLLPKLETAEPVIPSWPEVEQILEAIAPRDRPRRYPLVIRLLEALALRVGELMLLTWGDVDWTRGRFRISRSRSKTRGGQRWLAVPDELLLAIGELCPLEDRQTDRRVFPSGITEATVQNAMRRACVRAGIVDYSPHDLRHRRISLWSAQGTPPALLTRRAGHKAVSLTQDVYSHVVVPDDDVWADFWRAELAEGR